MYLPTDPGIYIPNDEDTDISYDPKTTIIASFSKDKIIELRELSKFRNCSAFSVASYDLDNTGMFSVLRGRGELSHNRIDDDSMFYNVVFLHEVPPGRNIQPPSIFVDSTEHYLWMNGELSSEEKDKIRVYEDLKENWDAKLMCHHIARHGSPVDVDGSFACMYCDGTDIYMFRNEKESLFFDDELTICSTPFVGSRTLPSNKVWKMNMKKKKLELIEEFQTVRRWDTFP